MIKKIIAREVLDSRGNPTVEADVILTEPCTKASPTTSNFSLGVVVPIPTLDVASSTIKPEPLDPPTV